MSSTSLSECWKSKVAHWVSESVSESVSDKVTYWAVRWQLKIVKMLVRSCFLITVIRCLKGQGLLGGSLMSKNKRWLSESVSHSVTRSPIELSWTAKNHWDPHQPAAKRVVKGNFSLLIHSLTLARGSLLDLYHSGTRDLESQLNRESAAYAEGVDQPVGEKRKALKYIFTFTSAHRGLERNLSRSAFFMSFSLIACLHKIWWKRAARRK